MHPQPRSWGCATLTRASKAHTVTPLASHPTSSGMPHSTSRTRRGASSRSRSQSARTSASSQAKATSAASWESILATRTTHA